MNDWDEVTALAYKYKARGDRKSLMIAACLFALSSNIA